MANDRRSTGWGGLVLLGITACAADDPDDGPASTSGTSTDATSGESGETSGGADDSITSGGGSSSGSADRGLASADDSAGEASGSSGATSSSDTGAGGCDPPCAPEQACLFGECVPDVDATTGGDTTTGGEDGPSSYPDPLDAPCPDGFLDGSVSGLPVCMPPCGPGDDPIAQCPQPGTGEAAGACLIISSASGRACEELGAPCPIEGEICSDFGGRLVCVAPPSHCGLVCAAVGGEFLSCPEGMECTPFATSALCVHAP
jgi:hypothetical protein